MPLTPSVSPVTEIYGGDLEMGAEICHFIPEIRTGRLVSELLTAGLFCAFIFAKTAIIVRAGAKFEIMPVSVSVAALSTAFVLSIAAAVVLTRRYGLRLQRMLSELSTPRTALFCGLILLIILSAGTAVHHIIVKVKVGDVGAKLVAYRMPLVASLAAPMTSSVLSICALIFLTRRCASPPQRLVSELMTPRTALFCGFVLAETAVIVRADAKFEIMPSVSVSVAALVTASVLLSLAAFVVLTRICASPLLQLQVRRGQCALNSVPTCTWRS